MAIQKTASGKVDKRTKEYKEMVARELTPDKFTSFNTSL